MTDSLRIGRVIELMNGGVASELPQCAGAIFRMGRAFDFGAPQPVADFSATLIGEGTRPVGWRTDNRTFVLPITITVPSTGDPVADRLTMVGAREVLLQVISADQFDMVWSPDGTDGSRNTIFECWHARAATITWDMIKDKQRLSALEISFEAMPYGRSDVLSTVNFDSPVTGVSAPAVPVVLDDNSAVSSSQQNTWWFQTGVTAYGTFAARWKHDLSNKESPLWYVHTISGTDITGLDTLTLWLGLGCDAGQYRKWHKGTVWFEFKLTDASARTITFGLTRTCEASSNQELPLWNLISAKIPQGKTFTYSNVTSYSVKVWSEKHHNKNLELVTTGYLSGLRAQSSASPRRVASARGGTYVLAGTVGTAPTRLSAHVQLSFQEILPSTKTIVLTGTPGASSNYTAPAENPNWLQGDTANADKGSTGTWTGADGLATNTTIAVSATQSVSAPNSNRMTAIAAADMLMAHCATTDVDVQGVPVAPGDWVSVRAQVRAVTTARTVSLVVEWFTAGKVSISSTSATSGTDANSSWLALTGRAQAPATAAYARLLIKVASAALGEQHYVDDAYASYAVQATVLCSAAGGSGGSVQPVWCSGGGGGGGEIAWDLNVALNPGGSHPYSIGKGGVPAYSGARGGDGGNSTFTGAVVTVTANGGHGGTNALTTDHVNATGGTGGTGSANAHHFNGGAGAAGSTVSGYPWGGGAGGGAGDGGAGGAGGGASGGAQGAAGSLAFKGGHGGAGSITLIIKSYQSVATFPSVILHVGHKDASPLAMPVVSVGNALDTPDGTTDYSCGVIDGQEARYTGSYSVVLAADSFNGAGARTITVYVNQIEATGAVTSQASVSASVDPALLTNKMVVLGNITLPLKDMAAENNDSYFTLNTVSANTADRFLDVILLDTRGQLAWVNMPGSGYTDYWFDAPDLTSDVGKVLGSMTDRSAAVTVLAKTFLSGWPLRLVPGENLLTVYSPSGMPALEADYWPRWWHERLS